MLDWGAMARMRDHIVAGVGFASNRAVGSGETV